jgi:hypothetical protein
VIWLVPSFYSGPGLRRHSARKTLIYISAYSLGLVSFERMSWHVHYRNGDQQFWALAADRKTAISVACILLRDGHEVVKLESSVGETIETREIQRLCER